mgnify:CR=1 FL=1
MTDLNTITIIGRVGQEPEYKPFDSGAVLTKFTLANNQYDTKSKANVTHWFNIETFSKLGDYISKGKLLAVEGKLRQSAWTDDNGNKKSRVYIFAENVQILTPKDKEKDTSNELIGEEEVPF